MSSTMRTATSGSPGTVAQLAYGVTNRFSLLGTQEAVTTVRAARPDSCRAWCQSRKASPRKSRQC